MLFVLLAFLTLALAALVVYLSSRLLSSPFTLPAPPLPCLSSLTRILGPLFSLPLTSFKRTESPSRSSISPSPLSSQLSAAPTPSLASLSVYFGSQSGTAESFARELAEEARLHGYKARVIDLEDFDEDSLREETFVVFLLATFGEGEPTDNAAAFYKWCLDDQRQEGHEQEWSRLRFAVFALGNRQYEHFCNVGRTVDRRLADHVGAQRLLEHGEGDDDGNLEEDFTQWKKLFWLHINTATGRIHDMSSLPSDLSALVQASSFAISYLKNDAERRARAAYVGGDSNFISDPKHHVVVALCVENRELRLCTKDGGSTRHIELDLRNVHLPYLTADNLGVYPLNSHQLVVQLATRLRLDLTTLFTLKPTSTSGKRSFLPHPCSVYDLITRYLDVRFCPRLSHLSFLAQHTANDNEKQLLHIWSHEKQTEFVADHWTLPELLDQLPGVQLSVIDLIELCPRITPRFYTISSSSLVQPKQVSITVSLLTHSKTRDRVELGLCSSYLSRLQPGTDNVVVFVRPSLFRLPKIKRVAADEFSTTSGVDIPPVIMIGAGTGIAPFRGFLQEAETVRLKKRADIGELTLIFGCRESKKDFIYENELVHAVEQKVLHRLHLAFSREPNQPRKVYVQDQLRINKEQIWTDIYERNASVFVCGGSAMGRAVRDTFCEVAREIGGFTSVQADQFLKKMHETKRFVQELWS